LEGGDEALGFAVPAWRVGRGEDVADLVALEELAEAAGVAVDHCPVGDHCFGR
jgi:hypothetical protein